jgi:hypothetical protein
MQFSRSPTTWTQTDCTSYLSLFYAAVDLPKFIWENRTVTTTKLRTIMRVVDRERCVFYCIGILKNWRKNWVSSVIGSPSIFTALPFTEECVSVISAICALIQLGKHMLAVSSFPVDVVQIYLCYDVSCRARG